MNIGQTIRNYRLQKGMSQGDIEKRTGLLRCYLSRVENGHTIPSLDTLANCGACGITCGERESCTDSHCQCAEGN